VSYPLLGDALALATIAHGDQPYGDQPYIVHPIAVARLILKLTENEHLGAAALLHDVVEDTFIDEAYLVRHGYSSRTVRAVMRVTRQPGEAYLTFVARAAADEDGRLIKLADNTHNLSGLPPGDRREGRYLKARRILVDAHGSDPWSGMVTDSY
jgi:GTP pyrophosphokinase